MSTRVVNERYVRDVIEAASIEDAWSILDTFNGSQKQIEYLSDWNYRHGYGTGKTGNEAKAYITPQGIVED